MIYRMKSNYVQRTYRGGSRIKALTGEASPEIAGALFPEDWTASNTAVTEESGEGLGWTVEGPSIRELLGNRDYPLLVKLLDSDERLVIQAHPTIPFAKAHCNSDHGKTECWYLLDCAEDACVYLGFREGVTRKAWRDLIAKQDVSGMLNALHRIPVKPGDFIFVEGGVPHAIGAGCFMIELQEPSDLMVAAEKVTPSGRPIPDARRYMGLGAEGSLDVYHYEPVTLEEVYRRWMPEPKQVADGVWEILGSDVTDKFSMLRMEGNAKLTLCRQHAVVIILEGTGSLNGRPADRGDRFFLQDETLLETSGEELRAVICY